MTFNRCYSCSGWCLTVYERDGCVEARPPRRRQIAEAHDWAVSVTESRDDGMRFEFRADRGV